MGPGSRQSGISLAVGAEFGRLGQGLRGKPGGTAATSFTRMRCEVLLQVRTTYPVDGLLVGPNVVLASLVVITAFNSELPVYHELQG